ncbi:MAG: hypothetical protein Alpg2KO_12150 [Alphaproteobacteria bacterium]
MVDLDKLTVLPPQIQVMQGRNGQFIQHCRDPCLPILTFPMGREGKGQTPDKQDQPSHQGQLPQRQGGQ